MNLSDMLSGVLDLVGDDTGGLSDYGVIQRINRAHRLVGTRLRIANPDLAIIQWETDLTGADPPAYNLPADLLSIRAVRLQGVRADPITEQDEPAYFEGPWYRRIADQILVSDTGTVTDGLFIEYEAALGQTELSLADDASDLPVLAQDLVVATAATTIALTPAVEAEATRADVAFRKAYEARVSELPNMGGGAYGDSV